MWHNNKKCRNCVLNGECLLEDRDVEDCDAYDEDGNGDEKESSDNKE